MPYLAKDANGDGDMKWIAVDSDASGAGSGSQFSIEFYDNGSQYQIQIYDFEDTTSTAQPSTGDHVMFRDVDGGPAVIYVNQSDFADWISSSIDGSVITGVLHTNLDFSGSGTIGTGKSNYNTDHDDTYWHTYDDSSHIDTKSYYTSGDVAANYFYVQDDLSNVWSSSGFDVVASDDVSITATNDIALTWGAASAWACNGNLTITQTSANIKIESSAEGANVFSIGDTTGLGQIKFETSDGSSSLASIDLLDDSLTCTSYGDTVLQTKSASTSDCYIGTAAFDWDDVFIYLSGDLKINGSAGLSGTLTVDDGVNWNFTLTFTHGILTGQTTGATTSTAGASWV